MTTPHITADRVGTAPVGTVPTPVVTTRVTRTSTRRWGIAVAIALAALLGTAGAFWLAAGSSPSARLAGWAPAGTVAYAEMRLDLATEQDGAAARFLANFPGFADRSRLDDKVTELGDRLLERATDGAVTYSSMKPWLGDVAAIALPRVPTSKADGTGLLVVSVTDPAALRDWIAKTVPAGGTTETHAGVGLTTGVHEGMAWAYAVLDTVFLAGERSAVTASIDTAGRSTFASDARFRTALAALDASVVGFAYLDGTAALDGALAAMPDGPGMPAGAAALRDLRDATPDWIVAGLTPTDDALEATVVAPRPAILDGVSLPAPRNATSVLAGRLPADTLLAVEGRDIGSVLVALAKRASDAADAAASASDGTAALLGLAGNAEALVGWMGDGALVVRPGAGGSTVEKGVVALVADEDAALATTRQLRALLTLAAGGSSAPGGLTFGTETYGDGEIVTLVVDDPAALLGRGAGAFGGELPALGTTGSEAMPSATLSWTVQRGLFVAGTSPEFVKAVVDAPSDGALATVERYRATMERAGGSNAGQVYVDVAGLAARLLPLLPADERTSYERDLKPFVDVLDGAAGAVLAGDPMRVQFVLTVK